MYKQIDNRVRHLEMLTADESWMNVKGSNGGIALYTALLNT